MAKLTILRGISGCGKSTWARQQNAKIVSRDDLRVMMFPQFDATEYYKAPGLGEREQEITVAQDALVGAYLRAGKDVIVDNTNIEWRFVKALAKIAYRFGAEVEVKVFDVAYTDAVHRDFVRGLQGGRTVGEDVILKQYNRFKMNKNMSLDPVQPVQPYTGTPGKPKAFLFDLDGTVYHMNDKRGPYDHNVDVDDPDQVIQEIVNVLAMSGEYVVIAMSGRKTATRQTTIECMERDGLCYDELFMRADGDDRPDNLIKADLFNEHVRDNFDVQFVLDDRDQVVDMWRRMGLKTLQVEPGDF